MDFGNASLSKFEINKQYNEHEQLFDKVKQLEERVLKLENETVNNKATVNFHFGPGPSC